MNEDIDLDNLDNLDDDDLLNLLNDYDADSSDSDTDNVGNNYCTECGSTDTIVEDMSLGIFVCNNCGVVVGSLMDKTPEWKQFDEDGGSSNTSSRCSGPSNHFLPQSSLGTQIGGWGRSKVRTLHGWYAMPYRERSLNNVLKEIQFTCRKNNILKYIEDDAKILYKNISECKHKKGKNKGKFIIIRGSNRRSLIFACIWFACRRKGCTRSLKEIADMGDLRMTELTKGCKLFLKLIKEIGMEYDLSASTAEHFIKRYCQILHIQKDYIDQTLQIANNIKKLNIASVHTPLSVATGSILLIATIHKLPITKKIIAKQFSVSEVTVAKAFKKLEPYRDILLNDQVVDDIAKLLDKEEKDSKIPDTLKSKMVTFNNEAVLGNIKDVKFNIGDSVDKYIDTLDEIVENSSTYTDSECEEVMKEGV